MRWWERLGLFVCAIAVVMLALMGLAQTPADLGVPLALAIVVGGAYLLSRRDDALREAAEARGRALGIRDAMWTEEQHRQRS